MGCENDLHVGQERVGSRCVAIHGDDSSCVDASAKFAQWSSVLFAWPGYSRRLPENDGVRGTGRALSVVRRLWGFLQVGGFFVFFFSRLFSVASVTWTRIGKRNRIASRMRQTSNVASPRTTTRRRLTTCRYRRARSTTSISRCSTAARLHCSSQSSKPARRRNRLRRWALACRRRRRMRWRKRRRESV